MVADPEPNEIIAILNCYGPVMDANPNRPKAAHFLEME